MGRFCFCVTPFFALDTAASRVTAIVLFENEPDYP